MKIHARIKVCRGKSGLTREAPATMVGVRRETILHLESNRYNPSLKLAYCIARALETSIEELLTLSKNDGLTATKRSCQGVLAALDCRVRISCGCDETMSFQGIFLMDRWRLS